MTEIEKIDIELTKQFELLNIETQSIKFEEICQFKIHEAAEKIPWNKIVYSGIYLLEIKNDQIFNDFELWIDNFRERWENEKYLKSFTPNIKKKRIRTHSELQEWVPVYIGKSKNIGSRIHGHLYTELHKTTFALKLLARENLFNDIFRLQTFKVNVQNYDAIVPQIEWQMRNKINPIIGKQ